MGVLTPLVLGGSYLEWAEASDASATIVPPLLKQLKIMTSKFTSFGTQVRPSPVDCPTQLTFVIPPHPCPPNAFWITILFPVLNNQTKTRLFFTSMV